jgi:hypothetical protein
MRGPTVDHYRFRKTGDGGQFGPHVLCGSKCEIIIRSKCFPLYPAKADSSRTSRHDTVFVPILLQKSFCEAGLKFSDPLVQ